MSDTLGESSTPNAFGASRLAQPEPPRAVWGLLDRKERWSLSWRGRLIVASALLLVGALVFRGVYPFLAITHRVNANILVVEGWIHEYGIRAAVKEFQSNHYEHVFTTGGPVAGSGGYINDFYTSASVGAELLKKWGLPDERLQMVPSRVMDRDRTYGSAVALRKWFGRPVGSVAIHHTGRNHLEALIWKAPFFQKLRAHTGRGVEIIDVSSRARYRSARRKDVLIVVTLKFLYRRPNSIFVYPPFDHKNICIDTMGYRKKWVNASENQSAH